MANFFNPLYGLFDGKAMPSFLSPPLLVQSSWVIRSTVGQPKGLA